MTGIVVVGGGQAGFSLCAKLRNLGYDGALTLFAAEPVLPYQRPPLSKAYLLGEMAEERLYFRPQSFYDDQQIDVRPGVPVDSIDPVAQSVSAGSGTLPYAHLALVTGAVPSQLPAAIGGTLAGVHTIRSLADIDRVRPEMLPGKRALVVGGGYIGLESAAVARKLGMDVMVIERADRILQRVAAAETSDYIRTLHRAHGVEICERTGLEALVGEGRVSAARLSDGREIPVDLVIVGIGVAPDTALAEAAGLAVDNGISVDAHGQTSVPAIWAAGDCASFPRAGTRIRLESVQNAIEQAESVAANMLGAGEPYDPKPWFWSDQYDVKLQIAGLNTGFDRVIVRQGEKAGEKAQPRSHWYYAGPTLLAVDAMNDARSYMIGKRLIEAGKSPAPELIADPASDLKATLKG